MSNKKRTLADPYSQNDDDNNNDKEEVEKEDTQKDKEISPKTSAKTEKEITDKYSNSRTFEEMHTRLTFLVKNEYVRKIDKICYNKKKGFKTHFINKMFEKYLDEYEDK